MRVFDYHKLADFLWDSEILSYVGNIHEFKGRQNFFLEHKPLQLRRLIDIAKIQSIDSSNRIEGIITTNARINLLMSEKTTPKTRDESEILGYRDVLNTIHENFQYIPVRSSYILQLHRDLFRYSYAAIGGKFKSVQNYINVQTSEGASYVLFTPLSPFETPDALDRLCNNYEQAADSDIVDELILIPIFISDFLCIHPFADGNGRMSRLLTTLMLYRHGYFVGRYISLEKIIEQTKSEYYDALRATSINWHTSDNVYRPFILYFLQTLMRAYKEFDERLKLMRESPTAYDAVKRAVDSTVGGFTKRDIQSMCPNISSSSIEAALKRLKDERYIIAIGAWRSTKYVRKIE